MTGYGQSRSTQQGMEVIVEVKTVNHRFLDLCMRLPKSLSHFEALIRNIVSERFVRGHVEVSLSMGVGLQGSGEAVVNLPLARSYQNAANLIQQQTGAAGKLTIADIISLPEVICLVPAQEDVQSMIAVVLRALDKACNQAAEDRTREGEKIKQDLAEHLTSFETVVKSLQAASKDQPLMAYEKLSRRFENLPDLFADPQRLAQEIALFTDRCDISEEINRLEAHCSQMRTYLEAAASVGREMDFLAQEMNREANTICSKSASLAITRLGLLCKNEVEKIREQIQNVE